MKEGDVVVLKSGGPRMTIEEINDDAALCQWFDGTKAQRERFPLKSLELYKMAGTPVMRPDIR